MAAGADDRVKRVDVGFSGGQMLALRMREQVYRELRAALDQSADRGWHEFATADSDLVIDLSQVVYVRLDTEEHRVGF